MRESKSNVSREQLIARAVKTWRTELIDFGRRNPLLYFKDLKTTTVDVAEVPAEAFSRLIAGQSVKTAQLFVEDEVRTDAVRRLRAIWRKVRELDEERGIRSGYLAVGMATWTDPDYRPAAPLLLYPVEIRATSSRQDDFVLELDNEPVVNPVLVEFLAARFGVKASAADFVIPEESNFAVLLDRVRHQLLRLTADVPGFALTDRRVIGSFNYAKLPMVADLEAAGDLLASHEIVAAVAGDSRAQRDLAATGADPGDPTSRAVEPAGEFLVLDADSSQSRAIDRVLDGRSLVIKGPPGTGKSQTIANLIASLIAAGERVLFVAEKRAAIDAVVKRLAQVGLDDLVLDAHDGAKARTRVIDRLKTALDNAGQIGIPDTDTVHRGLRTSRAKLVEFHETVHGAREPWGLSVFALHNELESLPERAAVATRLADDCLDRLDARTRELVAAELREYAGAEGFRLNADRTAWWGAQLVDTEQTQGAMAAAQRLDAALPRLVERLDSLAARLSVARPAALSQWRDLLAFVERVREVEEGFRSEIWAAPLPALVAATATAQWRKEHEVKQSWWQRRRFRKHIADVSTSERGLADQHELLSHALRQRDHWRRVVGADETPFVPEDFGAVTVAFAEFSTELAALTVLFPHLDVGAWGTKELGEWLSRLTADHSHPPLVQTLRSRRLRLAQLGLSGLLTELDGRRADLAETDDAFRFCFARSLLDRVELTDQRLATLRGDLLPYTLERFRRADRRHISLNAERVRRTAAERLYRARGAHPAANQFLQKQLGLKRSRTSMRKLFEHGDAVLGALAPCVAMSPLVVSQLLPARRTFDVVIFDEASQIPVPDAIPSIMRAERVVVTGDPKQLPPTSFFAATADEVDQADDDLSFTTGFQSILDSMDRLLDSSALTWHYRSRDERLISFSNRHVYDSSLTTFPGRLDGDAVSHILVPATGVDADERSSTAEVNRVVELILEHARQQPRHSLGVITMGITHARRIQAALDQARPRCPELDEFFGDESPEPFFVKNLERVQGDERDAIIMSLGYGRGPTGRMRHHFGPINQEGGQRRLNVAVTRAKRRMTVVSSFASADLDPDKLNAEGAKLLRAYLEFAESGGRQPGTGLGAAPALNPFEIDVRDRLVAAGIAVIPRFGVGGYRIDFAAKHPDRPGEMVLAIEADGAGFHSAASARDRDRIRQQTLEGMGWKVHRIWSTNWRRDRDGEIDKVKAAYAEAVGLANASINVPVPRPPAEPTVVAATPTADRGPCPIRTGRKAITDYRQDELVELLCWLLSDQRLRTDEELRSEARKVLGFRRNGSRINAALTNATATARTRHEHPVARDTTPRLAPPDQSNPLWPRRTAS